VTSAAVSLATCARPPTCDLVLSPAPEDHPSSPTAERAGWNEADRGDLYHGQPCPTDPPSYEYSWLYTRFGWDYYICHTFDSPW
jgi:hypothetical protein